ncbi:hypothetical protein LIA77_07228 [Sarocladium implicatum]|nr:hypothetical protein LIA77_07228 [Sarocladium implicatum]
MPVSQVGRKGTYAYNSESKKARRCLQMGSFPAWSNPVGSLCPAQASPSVKYSRIDALVFTSCRRGRTGHRRRSRKRVTAPKYRICSHFCNAGDEIEGTLQGGMRGVVRCRKT